MDKKTKVRVRILGNEYTFVGEESREYIIEVCSLVDEKMKEFSKGADMRPIKASVLAAVNFCDEALKAKKALEELDKYKEEIASLKNEVKALEEEKNFLKDEIKTIRKSKHNGKY